PACAPPRKPTGWCWRRGFRCGRRTGAWERNSSRMTFLRRNSAQCESATIRPMIEIEDLYEPEWAAGFRMTPQERWEESARLWHHYIAMGGPLDPEPDPQSPFYDPETSGRPPVDGRPGLRVIRRSGV